MKITVIGTGYVGLVSGAVFADWGHDVVCLDVDEKKIEMIKKGVMPIYEEGLQDLVERMQKEKRFVATTDYKMAVEHGDLVFICVGTPGNQSGAANLDYVFSAAQSVGKYMKDGDYKVVITKSTVPVGTHMKVKESVQRGLGKTKAKFDVASNPEFLREGSSIYDANNVDRVVIGSDSEKALDLLEELNKHLNCPILRTDLASAELIKYAANAFLATKVSFINEISQICERTGADVKHVADGMGYDKRIGRAMLYASMGFGGSCFPKDVEALYRTSSEKLYDFRLLRGVIDANERQKHYFFEKIVSKFGSNLTNHKFGVLGAAFKAGTDDTRKSSALEIIKYLRGSGAHVKLFDPAALENAKNDLGDDCMTYETTANKVFDDVDAVVILTEWPEFIELDYKKLAQNMKSKVIFDGRNILDPLKMKNLGIEYYAIGRRTYN